MTEERLQNEISEISPEVIKEEIASIKSSINEKSAYFKPTSKKLISASKALEAAANKAARKPNSKTERALEDAQLEHDAIFNEYVEALAEYTILLDSAAGLYGDLIEMAPPKVNKVIKESQKFEAEAAKLKATAYGFTKDLADVGEAVEAYIADKLAPKEAPVEEESTAAPDPAADQNPYQDPNNPMYAQPGYNPMYGQPMYGQPMYGQPMYGQPMYAPPVQQNNVNIAPTTIDIAPIVQEAVNTAMQKFNAAFAARADEAISNASAQSSANIAAMQQKIADDEKYVVEKLAPLLESVKELIESVTNISASYMQTANLQKDAVELQRRVNDMQKALARDLQGVQVNQRVINQDQAEISEAQMHILEQEKATAEAQKAILLAREVAALNDIEAMKASIPEEAAEIIEKAKNVKKPRAKVPAKEAAPETAAQKADGVELPDEVALDELKSDGEF